MKRRVVKSHRTRRSASVGKRRKLRVGVVFGGRSVEHQVSLVSAASVIGTLDPARYEVVPIGITVDGRWVTSPDALERLKSGADLADMPDMWIVPDPTVQALIGIDAKGRKHSIPLDVLFPVLHGKFGEDGSIQGLFEMANIPYVGAGVLGSSVGMDKVVTKQLFERSNIPVTPYIWFTKDRFNRDSSAIVRSVAKNPGYPCFVKPANSGSSVGISKANDERGLKAAIECAMGYDTKILIEKGIQNAREIEVSVLGHDDPEASVPGEIMSSNEFYDYDAKYVDGKSQSVIPAELPRSVSSRIRSFAVRGFLAIACSGMARADFLVTKRSNRIYCNEINTIPGFTSISMYPKLWEASGVSFRRLLDRLIEIARHRHREQRSLKCFYRPKKEWYSA